MQSQRAVRKRWHRRGRRRWQRGGGRDRRDDRRILDRCGGGVCARTLEAHAGSSACDAQAQSDHVGEANNKKYDDNNSRPKRRWWSCRCRCEEEWRGVDGERKRTRGRVLFRLERGETHAVSSLMRAVRVQALDGDRGVLLVRGLLALRGARTSTC